MKPFVSDFEVEAPYAHSTGEALGRWFDSLKERRILGRRCDRCDRVLVPALEYCETCGGTLDAWTDIGPFGIARGFAPRDGATRFARIRLDGADVDLLHIVGMDVERGARVQPVWAAEPTGTIFDIERFEAVP